MNRSQYIYRAFHYLLTIFVLLCLLPIIACDDQKAGNSNKPSASTKKAVRDYAKDRALYEKTMRAQTVLDEYFGDDNNFTVAKQLLDEVLNADDTYVPAHIQMARLMIKELCARDCKAYEPVEKILVNAMNLDPDYADTYVLMGHLYNLKNDYMTAAQHLDKARQLGTMNPWLYYNYGDISLGKYELHEADILYEMVVGLGPGNTSQQRKAYISALERQQNIAYQLSQSDRLLSLAQKTVAAAHPKDAWTWGNTANHLCREGFFDEGIEYSKKALSIMQYGAAYGYIAFCSYGKWAELTAEGRSDEAQKYFDEAFQLDPDIKKIAEDFSGCGQKLRVLRPVLDKKIEALIKSTEIKGAEVI